MNTYIYISYECKYSAKNWIMKKKNQIFYFTPYEKKPFFYLTCFIKYMKNNLLKLFKLH